MPLFLNNDDVERVITMKDTMAALEILYSEMGGEGERHRPGSAARLVTQDVHP